MTQGPIRGLRFVHEAIRVEAHYLEHRIAAFTNATDARDVVPAVKLLTAAVRGHVRGEDVGYFPALAERAPGALDAFVFDHDEEAPHLDRYDALAESCAAGTGDLAALKRMSVSIHEHLRHHMAKEEAILWPLTERLFSPAEQGGLLGAVVAAVPRESMPVLVPWIVDRQSHDEAVAYVKLLATAMPPPAFEAAKGWIRGGVRPETWQGLVSRVEGLA